jgi:hypothetical protein
MAYFGNDKDGKRWLTEMKPVPKAMQNKKSTETYVEVKCHSSWQKLSSPEDGQLYAVIQEDHPFQIVPIEDSEYLLPRPVLDWFIRYSYRNVRLFGDLFNDRSSIQEMRKDLDDFTDEVKDLLAHNQISEKRTSKGFENALENVTKWLDNIDSLINSLKDENPITIGAAVSNYLESVVREIRTIKEEEFGSSAEVKDALKYAVTTNRRKWFTAKYPLGVVYGDEIRPNTYMSTVLMDYLATNVHYLGPLRSDPGSIQQLDSIPNSLTPVGTKGEYLAFQLKSGEFALKKQELPVPEGETAESITLIQALSKWVKFLGLGSKIDLIESGPLGFTTLVDDVPIFATGTGISQVLPVLTICLLAKPGSVVLIEQPELHLHPGSQRKLADFFLKMSESGRNIVVETHSEYLLNRLRHSVAVVGKPKDLISVVFTESVKDGKQSETVFRQASIQETGDLTTWPEGFFDFSDLDNLEIMLNNFKETLPD